MLLIVLFVLGLINRQSSMLPIPIISFVVVMSLIRHGSASPTFLYTYCPNTTFFPSTNSAYRSNIHALLTQLSSAANLSSSPGFHYNSTSSSLYGLYLCRGDVTPSTCRDCVATAELNLPQKCPQGKEAVIWYDECMVRYSNTSMFRQLDSDFHLIMSNPQTITSNVTGFSQVLYDTLIQVAEEAASSGSAKKYAAEEARFNAFQSVYALGQCTPDLSSDDCNQCLQQCIEIVFLSLQGARVLFLSCSLRYEIYLFYKKPGAGQHPLPGNRRQPSPAPAAHASANQGNGRQPPSDEHLYGIISASIVGVLMLLFTVALWFYLQKKKAKREMEDVQDIITAESLQMEFNTIRAATQNFAADRKLGQGGFGEVYKGTLENGQEIAVKRLSKDSGQGVAEFKTEVILVAKLQHRNLVKLLGFCVSRQERILVYEYLPNSSLDKFLFDPTKKVLLSWDTRFKIINGIARGLLYLHEDSRLKIIHRDLKTSNILLDEAMNPKIADFGLAKLFGVDQTQDATNTIVGTYGYMAPEYILTGHYSVKSDVYTFGIIMLELISGQRNKYLNRSHLEEALLHRAWRLWTEDEALKLVDETLGDSISVEDLMKCIHIGLLCIQENAARRPSMVYVVAALGGQSIKLPSPMPPNFLAPEANSTSGSNPGQAASVYTISDISTLDSR